MAFSRLIGCLLLGIASADRFSLEDDLNVVDAKRHNVTALLDEAKPPKNVEDYCTKPEFRDLISPKNWRDQSWRDANADTIRDWGVEDMDLLIDTDPDNLRDKKWAAVAGQNDENQDFLPLDTTKVLFYSYGPMVQGKDDDAPEGSEPGQVLYYLLEFSDPGTDLIPLQATLYYAKKRCFAPCEACCLSRTKTWGGKAIYGSNFAGYGARLAQIHTLRVEQLRKEDPFYVQGAATGGHKFFVVKDNGKWKLQKNLEGPKCSLKYVIACSRDKQKGSYAAFEEDGCQ